MVHIESGPTLRAVLSEARPTWSEKDLAAVEEKLSRVGVTTAEKLAELLSNGLNKRLLAAGQKAFNSETLAALRQRLSRESPTQDKDDCEQQARQAHASEGCQSTFSSGREGNDCKQDLGSNNSRQKKPVEPKPSEASFVQTTFSPSAPFGRQEALGETPLIKAVRQTDVRTVQYLLEHRSNPNEKDNFGETALMEAAAVGHPQLCKILLENCANVAYKSPTGLSAKDFASEHEVLSHLFAVPGNYWLDRGLRLAARQHNLGKADLLLKRVKEEKQPIDVNKADGNGFTPLHVCTARSPDSSDGLGFAKLLLEEKAIVNATNLLGETPLILATRASADTKNKSCRLSIVKLLLESRAAVNTSDSVLHETPLMEAAGIGDSELVLTLLRAGADHLRSSASGQTALDFARAEEVQWMLKNPMQATSGSPWPSAPRPQPNAPVPPPVAQPKTPLFTKTQPLSGYFTGGTKAGPSKGGAMPKLPQTYAERLQRLLAKYPGFVGSGVDMPSHAWQWTNEELELFIGSMGQFWPPNRAKPSMKPPPNAGHQLPPSPPSHWRRITVTGGRKAPPPDPWDRPRPSLRPFYEVLGLPDGTKNHQVLKKAYRQAALKWHPDKNPNDPHAASNFQKACNAFEQICKALGLGNL
ncbi:unnamed protein product [Durusdinium trenchii]|uniref:J domain-containing protein n=1 Tax=Durusdinium trenchii TaxID=1381693 RepID=A0ABP0S5F4_9DINO